MFRIDFGDSGILPRGATPSGSATYPFWSQAKKATRWSLEIEPMGGSSLKKRSAFLKDVRHSGMVCEFIPTATLNRIIPIASV